MKRLLIVVMAVCMRGSAQEPAGDLGARVRAMVSEPAVARAHWGVMVTAMDGSVLYSMNEGQLFQPASNTKLFTTAAALALLGRQSFETRLVGKGHFSGPDSLAGDLVLIGDGDANLSGRAVPYVAPLAGAKGEAPAAPALRYLEEMADAVARSGLKVVSGDVIGDDKLFPWEPYPIDWAEDDLIWEYGAPVSALTINDNQIKVTVKPGAAAGAAAEVTLDPAVAYYTVDASELTTGAAKSGEHVEFERAAGSKALRVYGLIAADAPPEVEEIAIADPADYAAIALKAMLEARGITVTGTARAEHRLPKIALSFAAEVSVPISNMAGPVSSLRAHGDFKNLAALCKGCEGRLPAGADATMERTLAVHDSHSVSEDVAVTNKVSQNLHAELLLHQLGAAVGSDGSTAQGVRVVRSFAINAGVDKDDFVFFDGSGLSGHDLVAPRAIAKLLQFASTQPWFAEYKASLPVAGVDGSLQHRFAEGPLKGHVFAKTGSLGEARALSGYLECASGRTVIFSVMVGNHAPGSNADREVMDRMVAAIAAAE